MQAREQPVSSTLSSEASPASNSLIVVVGERRSGTTVFRSLLQENGARSLGEIFHKDEIHLDSNFFKFLLKAISQKPSLIHPSRQGAVFEDYLKFITTEYQGTPVVMDIKFPALSLIKNRVHGTPEVIKLLNKKNARFLIITRKNKLRCYISEQIALRNKKWHGDFSTRSPVRVNVRDALAYVSQSQARASALKSWLEGSIFLETSYEEMFDGSFFSKPAIEVASILLGKDVATSKPTYEKQNPEHIAELVTNYSELQDAFTETDFAWMLD